MHTFYKKDKDIKEKMLQYSVSEGRTQLMEQNDF